MNGYTCHIFNTMIFCALCVLLQIVSLCPGLTQEEVSGSCSVEGVPAMRQSQRGDVAAQGRTGQAGLGCNI